LRDQKNAGYDGAVHLVFLAYEFRCQWSENLEKFAVDPVDADG
jgi:hypothetical protein